MYATRNNLIRPSKRMQCVYLEPKFINFSRVPYTVVGTVVKVCSEVVANQPVNFEERASYFE